MITTFIKLNTIIRIIITFSKNGFYYNIHENGCCLIGYKIV